MSVLRGEVRFSTHPAWSEPMSVPRFIRSHATLSILLALLGTPAWCIDIQGDWRVFRQQLAPWVVGAASVGAAGIELGERLSFSPEGLSGPAVLACAEARYSTLQMPVEGLFQGELPEPERNAERLGLASAVQPSVRLDCANGSFDFHLADADTLLFALDHRIYSASRAYGALAGQDSPEAALQALLERHFGGDMGFSLENWADKRGHLTTALNQRIDAYAAAEWPADEVPPINGDPLTDSQEYPTRFAVRQGHGNGSRVPLEVDFADAHRSKRLVCTMQFEHGRWLLDDVHGESGESFLDLLAERP
jgi:hypothetical protein